MTKTLSKLIFPLLALLLLAPWPVAYAYTYNNNGTTNQDVVLEVAEASAQPNWTVVSKAIGGVSTPGTLFYIDSTNSPGDVQATLYLTNGNELIRHYRFLMLKVGVYIENGVGDWERASIGNGEPIPEILITMQNGQVSFTLPGLAKYKVTIDGGSFYSTTTNTDNSNLAPQFYLEVD